MPPVRAYADVNVALDRDRARRLIIDGSERRRLRETREQARDGRQAAGSRVVGVASAGELESGADGSGVDIAVGSGLADGLVGAVVGSGLAGGPVGAAVGAGVADFVGWGVRDPVGEGFG